MSTLNAASTDSQVWQAYDDNASFEEDGDATKAAAFITACRILLRRRPQTMTFSGNTSTFEPNVISAELNRARRWLAANDQNVSNRFVDFSDFRC